MEFGLTESQKGRLCASFNHGLSLYKKKAAGAPVSLLGISLFSAGQQSQTLVFSQRSISIRQGLLKEVLKRGYLEIRVKKTKKGILSFFTRERFKCFMFEVCIPFEYKTNGNMAIRRIVNLNEKESNFIKNEMHFIMSTTLYKRPNDRKRIQGTNYLIFLSPLAEVLPLDNFLILHAHPCYMLKKEVAWLSPTDFAVILNAKPGSFIISFALDLRRFMREVDTLGNEAFDGDGMLKEESIKAIAEKLAVECSVEDYLNRFYDKAGMPLVGCYKNNDKLEVFANLKII